MESARYSICTKKKRFLNVMALPPTSANHLQHILRANLQSKQGSKDQESKQSSTTPDPVMLWITADCEGPPDDKLLMGLQMKFLYRSLLKGILLHLITKCDAVSVQSSGQEVFYEGIGMHATSITCHARHSATVIVDMIACIHSLQPEKLSNLPKRRLKQIALTATFQMVLMMVLNKTLRREVFLTTHFGLFG